MALDLIRTWTLATQTTLEVANTTAGRYEWGTPVNRVIMYYYSGTPAVDYVLVKTQAPGEAYNAASATKGDWVYRLQSWAVEDEYNHFLDIFDDQQIAIISVWLPTGMDANLLNIMGRFETRGK